MLIPRALKAISDIRNKRGIGHLSDVSANEIDATYMLYACKWVFAELIRISSPLAMTETQKVVDEIVEREVGLLWKSDAATRVLNTSLKARDQVLVLLYNDSPRSAVELRGIIEYRNKTNFTKILKRLHTDRDIEFSENGDCHITPKGVVETEDLIHSSNYDT